MQNLKHYIVDGNNLIGKDKNLSKVQRVDKQNARKGAVTLLEQFAHLKKVKISLHFDGHPDDSLKSGVLKINYSFNKEADYFIKKEIDGIKNKSNVIVVSSDSSISQYARVSGCGIIQSENFLKELVYNKEANEEEDKIKGLDNTSEFKKLFGVE
jgi:predicted RNA-binding protein with PIN domain